MNIRFALPLRFYYVSIGYLQHLTLPHGPGASCVLAFPPLLPSQYINSHCPQHTIHSTKHTITSKSTARSTLKHQHHSNKSYLQQHEDFHPHLRPHGPLVTVAFGVAIPGDETVANVQDTSENVSYTPDIRKYRALLTCDRSTSCEPTAETAHRATWTARA
jgi:hypothetical protein